MQENLRLMYEYEGNLHGIKTLNSSFDYGILDIAYDGLNRNGSKIDKAVFERCASTMYNCPIVCNYSREDDSIGGHDVDVQFFLAPFFKAGGFALVAVHFGAAHQDLAPRDEGGNEADDAAHERDLCGDAHPLGGMQAAAFHLNVAFGIAHGRGIGLFSAHHHPFQHRLAADVGAAVFFLFFTHECDVFSVRVGFPRTRASEKRKSAPSKP